jgi:hypothetical protein
VSTLARVRALALVFMLARVGLLLARRLGHVGGGVLLLSVSSGVGGSGCITGGWLGIR